MVRIFFMLFFTMYISFSLAQGDTVYTKEDGVESYHIIEDIEKDTTVLEYWKYKYYDAIPVGKGLSSSNSETYEEMISKYQNKDFEYVESISERLNFLDKLIYRLMNFLRDIFPDLPVGEFHEGLTNILAIVGGVLALFLIYKFFVSKNKIFISHKKEDEEAVDDQIDFVERNLMDVDIKTYIKEAEANKNYALAIRYQHLLNIQVLSEKNLIEWKQNKTNMELMDSVANQELKNDFMACASIFDYVWFGDFTLTEADYNKYAVRFQEFQRRWK